MGSFKEHFWGEKNNGFFVLMNNMKQGQDSTKEFSDFLRESCSVEERYSQMLGKVAKYAGTCHSNSKGTFFPVWAALRTLVEKVSLLHMQLVYSWQDLSKDIQRYSDEQHRKLKASKEVETNTQESVQTMQATVLALQKAKETYYARRIEFEKAKRDSVSAKDMEKVENKYKKAYDDYLGLVDKYATVRSDFENKMSESCTKFQETEEGHLEKMKDFVDTYAKAWENHQHKMQTIYSEFSGSSSDLNIAKLVSLFIESKATGTEMPGTIHFEEVDLSALPPPASTPDSDKKELPATSASVDKPRKELPEGARGVENMTSSSGSSKTGGSASTTTPWSLPLRNTAWFLSKRKKKDKKKKKKDENREDEKVPSQQVDEEGYAIPPSDRFNTQLRDSSSSSDSDSDTEPTRFHVQIKPKEPNGSAVSGVDNTDISELMRQAQGIRLSPVPTRRQTPVPDMRKSNSVSEQLSNSQQGDASFDAFGLKSGSNNSDSSSNQGTSLNSFNLSGGSPDSGGRRTPASLSRLPGPPGSIPGPPGSIPGPPGSLPGPPGGRTSRSALRTSVDRQSTSMERMDSVTSLDRSVFNTSNPYGMSRGPSPLTLGMSDSIPIAVAFSETVNALFKGQDLGRCIVKITGEMMVSFPAGIIKVLMDNMNPATLTFRLHNLNQLQQVLVNKQLVQEDSGLSNDGSRVYSFVMPALTTHLRRQAEQTRTASYFNIDILKYQVRSRENGGSVPLHLSCGLKWHDETGVFRLDYCYNSAAVPARLPLHQVTALLPVSSTVAGVTGQPPVQWTPDTGRAVWKLGDVSATSSRGSIRATLSLPPGASTPQPSPVALQFLCEGSTLSGLDLELACSGYRLSLVKKRFITGKYLCEDCDT